VVTPDRTRSSRTSKSPLQVRQRGDALLVVVVDPAFGDLVDGRGVEVVTLLPAPADGGHEVGVLQDGQVLADRLAGHVQTGAQLTQTLPVTAVQGVEQPSPAGVGQRPEHLVHGGQPRLLMFMSSA
jgi:hypothetical protein